MGAAIVTEQDGQEQGDNRPCAVAMIAEQYGRGTQVEEGPHRGSGCDCKEIQHRGNCQRGRREEAAVVAEENGPGSKCDTKWQQQSLPSEIGEIYVTRQYR